MVTPGRVSFRAGPDPASAREVASVETPVADEVLAEVVALERQAVSEIEQGICKLRRSGGTERADGLARWLDALLADGDDRILERIEHFVVRVEHAGAALVGRPVV